jgi:hypothetical protein
VRVKHSLLKCVPASKTKFPKVAKVTGGVHERIFSGSMTSQLVVRCSKPLRLVPPPGPSLWPHVCSQSDLKIALFRPFVLHAGHCCCCFLAYPAAISEYILHAMPLLLHFTMTETGM